MTDTDITIPERSTRKDAYPNADTIKQWELNILQQFRSFCEAHSLRYSLTGGTLLGAIRHGGFIPWDDDIDVSMPRPDYERLISLKDQLMRETGMDLSGFSGCDIALSPFIKMINPKIRAKIADDLEEGFLWIDIFPVDGVPDDPQALELLFKRANLLRRYIFFLTCAPESKSSVAQRTLMTIIPPLIRAIPGSLEWGLRKLMNLSKSTSYDESESVATVGWGLYGPGERMDKAAYERTKNISFEGELFAAMECWDEYLSGVYGDYMTLPPESERKTHNVTVKFVD